MTLVIRILSSLFILSLCVTQMPSIMAAAVILFFLVIVSLRSSVHIREIIKRNIILLPFIVFYFVFGSVSVFASGGEYFSLLAISVKIVFIFNIIWLSSRWLGTWGMLYLMDKIPSEKIRLYLILVVKGIYLFRRNSGMIVMQIRSRLEPGRESRRLLSGYYIRNMIFRYIYSVHYMQAALYSRLPERLIIYAPKMKPGFAEGIICIAITVFITAVYIMKL